MRNSQKGATFVELLIVVIIAVAAFGLALVGLLRLAVVSTNQTVEFSNMQNEASIIMRMITNDVRRSTSVALIDPTSEQTDHMRLHLNQVAPNKIEFQTDASDNLLYTDVNDTTSILAEDITYFNIEGIDQILGDHYKTIRLTLTKTSNKTNASPRNFTLTTSAAVRVPGIIASKPVLNLTRYQAGQSNCFFNEIVPAVNASSSGDNILVSKGTYDENVRLTSNLSVLGGYDTGFTNVLKDSTYNPSNYGSPIADPYRDTSANETIVDGGGKNKVFDCAGSGPIRIDGFTITNGKAQRGGGIYCIGLGTLEITISNNIIAGNTCDGPINMGGGIWSSGPTMAIENNQIVNNLALSGGAEGIYCTTTSATISISGNSISGHTGSGIITIGGNIVINNHNIISNNTTAYPGGGIRCSGAISAHISNNVIAHNTANGGGGGGIYSLSNSSITISDNTIAANTCLNDGGGICSYQSQTNISGNVISGNTATSGSGGGISYGTNNTDHYLNATNNIITQNKSVTGGGIEGGNPNGELDIISNNTIIGNIARVGGGVYYWWPNGPFSYNLVAGNYAELSGGVSGYGGGFFFTAGGPSASPVLNNNTIIRNTANVEGGGIVAGSSAFIAVKNNLIWNNIVPNNKQIAGGFSTVSYSDIEMQSGTFAGTENINSDPVFTGNPLSSGQWSSAPTYNTNTYQTTLTDSSSPWAAAVLADLTINPNTGQPLLCVIADNTADTVVVWGDITNIVSSGDSYEIFDYHLKDNTSPCFNTGDPDTDGDGIRFDDPATPDTDDQDPDGTQKDMGAYYFHQ
ncbi:right-handed parallel beta-helix repeat-containing protein [Candidatus Omnitrophota bacterium]